MATEPTKEGMRHENFVTKVGERGSLHGKGKITFPTPKDKGAQGQESTDQGLGSQIWEVTLNGLEDSLSPQPVQRELCVASQPLMQMDITSTLSGLTISEVSKINPNSALVNKSPPSKVSKRWKKRARIKGVLTISNFHNFSPSSGHKRARENLELSGSTVVR